MYNRVLQRRMFANGGAVQAQPPMMQPPMAPPMAPPMSPDEGVFAPTGGIPPELLLQLQNQMGLELPSL